MTGVGIGMALALTGAKKAEVPVWTDPDEAFTEHPGFAIQGEYVRGGDAPAGRQVAAKEEGFVVLTYPGGLPGEGWDGGDLKSEVVSDEEIAERLAGWEKVERKSPTLGAKPPEGAVVLFSGEPADTVEGEVKDELLWAGSQTTVPLRDFHLHLEFRLPYKPGRNPGSQDRGNSGVYLFNNYECQVLDSFALDFDEENNAITPESRNTQWCASFYKMKIPDVPMSLPPLAWQTYDIDFRAPRFVDGEKTENARITVRHNGVVVHDDVEMETGTGAGGKRPEKPEGLIYFQGHGNPVAFRNIWAVPQESVSE